MDNSKYIETIKNIIASKAKEFALDHDLNPSFFTKLLPEIKKSILLVFKTFGLPVIDDITLEKYYVIAKNEYLSVNPIDIDPSNSLTREGFRTWLNEERKAEMEDSWNYTDRYLKLLALTGRSEKVIEETRQSSLEILEKLGDPKSSQEFFCRGLVVGGVQSGKTANFNAVINRAIDSGYGLIIVLSGIMEDLRYQTQLRIENDVIGTGVIDLDKETKGIKGVGKIRRFGSQGDSSVEQVIAVTSFKSDFNKPLADADFSLDFTNVLVCKKNVSVLRNLIVWLHDFLEEYKDKHNIPLLILDDEADNASLNNEGKKGREYANKTNGHIRALLELFKRKTYLGYTATPFANVLADRNEAPENEWIVKYKLKGQPEEISLPRVGNLFPDDFIVLLNPPSNYIGAKQIFETIKPISNKAGLKIPLLEVVDDNTTNFPDRVYIDSEGVKIGIEKINNQDEWDEKFWFFSTFLNFPNFKEYKNQTFSPSSNDNFPKNLPNSLKDSILCFILSIAIRESRKPHMMYSTLFNPHHSMLIHISRYTKWQITLKKLISDYVNYLKSSIENDDPNNPNLIFTVFEKIWYKYYANIIENITNYLPHGYDDEFLIPVSFETIKINYLTDAINNIEVKAINSVTKDKLVYQNKSPKKVIAIGGNRLSRGFTLEGLTINYFVRTTNYSDTLLQMGRWFGYRPGYLDCCKLFTTEDSIEKYDSVTRAIEELEIEFCKMEEQVKTPRNFVLRVKKHPGTLKITRPAILKNTVKINWSYQDSLEQTTNFSLKKEKIEKVWNDFKNSITYSYSFEQKKNQNGTEIDFLTCKTDITGIINILNLENNFGKDTKDSLIRFIELCKEKNKLTNWTIAIKARGDANSKEGKGILKMEESNLPQNIQMTIRRGPKKSNPISENKYRNNFLTKKIFGASGKSANIISSGSDLSILLDDNQKQNAIKEFRELRQEYYKKKNPDWSNERIIEEAKKINPPERIYREKMNDQEGLLLIYILDTYYVFLQEKGIEDSEFKDLIINEDIDLNIPLIGYAIAFPPIEPDPGSEYVRGDYGIEEEEFLEENEEDSELPTDAKEI